MVQKANLMNHRLGKKLDVAPHTKIPGNGAVLVAG
jgi:hypothetical protein